MKVELTQSRCGFNFVQEAGDIVEVSNAEAGRMIENGSAIPVREESKKIEKAIKRFKK
jgi:hypothetical protein